MEKILLSVEDALALTGVKRTTLYELIRSRQLESVKIGRRRLIPHQSLLDYVERLRTEARDDAAEING